VKNLMLASTLSVLFLFLIGTTGCSDKVIKRTKTVKITMEKNDNGVKLMKADTTVTLDTIPASSKN